jgi:hypothetical protein
MRRSSVTLLATALCVGTLSTARDVHALGPIGLEIGAKAGAGTNPDSSGPNPLGFGIGARGGVTFLGLYGGLNFMYYLGSSQSQTVGGSSFSESVHSTQYGVEAGYGLTLSLLTLRAQLGIGNFTVTGSGGGQVAGGSSSESSLYLEPGVTAMVSLGMWFVGADVNALVLTGLKDDSTGNSSTKSALTFHGQLGLTF